MSGIIGILNRDRRPLDRSLLNALTRFLSFRGPDDLGVWSNGGIGFGHTMLRTTYEAEREKQPADFERRFFITADVRLDQRAELIAALKQKGIEVPRSAADPDLILRSYAAWGEDCVEHLRGDFAFAIWDAGDSKLFCARDHFGIKPFYYVDLKDAFIFSNTLDCLRAYPDVSDELNDEAIADFLLFGLNCDVTTTTFRDIRRLPGAHTLAVSARGLRVRRYWSPPIDGRIRYRRPEEYVEVFLVLFRQAVADRMRTDRILVSMSGGLDSPAIAAIAKEFAQNPGHTVDLRASTIVYDSLIADEERHYAGEVAKFLALPIEFVPYDDVPFFSGDIGVTSAEPIASATLASDVDLYKKLSRQYRVMLAGDGSDNLMEFQMWPYLTDLAGRGDWPRFLVDSAKYLWIRPFPWRGIKSRVQSLFRASRAQGAPAWIEPDFAERANLAERQRIRNNVPVASSSHPIFPKGHASLFLPHWASLFECEDPGFTRSPIETGYPFLDLRVVDFLLALPSFPWAFHKSILRQAMHGKLPKSVLTRQKAPLAQDPSAVRFAALGSDWLDRVVWDDRIKRYVSGSAVSKTGKEKARRGDVTGLQRCLALNFWLRSSFGVRYNLMSEVGHA